MSTLRSNRGPRYQISGESPQARSASVQAFKDATDGLTGRLRLTGLDGMRRGTTNNPYSLALRYLVAGRTAALPRAWAQGYAVWVQRQVDFLWPMDHTPLAVLEQKAMALEGADDLCEKRNDLEGSAITVRERIASLTNEIVADQLVLARLEAEIERAQ